MHTRSERSQSPHIAYLVLFQLATQQHQEEDGGAFLRHTAVSAPARDMASAGLMGRRWSRTSTSPRPGLGTGLRMTAAQTHTVVIFQMHYHCDIEYCYHKPDGRRSP